MDIKIKKNNLILLLLISMELLKQYLKKLFKDSKKIP
jgi:hypothetical protein